MTKSIDVSYQIQSLLNEGMSSIKMDDLAAKLLRHIKQLNIKIGPWEYRPRDSKQIKDGITLRFWNSPDRELYSFVYTSANDETLDLLIRKENWKVVDSGKVISNESEKYDFEESPFTSLIDSISSDIENFLSSK